MEHNQVPTIDVNNKKPEMPFASLIFVRYRVLSSCGLSRNQGRGSMQVPVTFESFTGLQDQNLS